MSDLEERMESEGKISFDRISVSTSDGLWNSLICIVWSAYDSVLQPATAPV